MLRVYGSNPLWALHQAPQREYDDGARAFEIVQRERQQPHPCSRSSTGLTHVNDKDSRTARNLGKTLYARTYHVEIPIEGTVERFTFQVLIPADAQHPAKMLASAIERAVRDKYGVEAKIAGVGRMTYDRETRTRRPTRLTNEDMFAESGRPSQRAAPFVIIPME